MRRMLTLVVVAFGVLLLIPAGIAAGKTPTGCTDAAAERGHLNRLENAATPEPFRCFAPHDGDVKGHKGKFDLYLGSASDGIDPSSERVLISVSGERHVFEPGALVPHGREKWRYESKTGAVRKLELKGPKQDGRVELNLDLAKDGPGYGGGKKGPGQGLLLVRIGDDWGGLDLATGVRVDGSPALDAAAAASAVIGAGGGTVAAGGFTLDVPAGALTADTTLTLTPFADGSGLRLEPHGLRFAVPATLSGGPGGPLALLTSPLSGLPLYGGTGGVVLWHFSDVGLADAQDTDFGAWADAVLGGAGQITLSEIQQLLALAEFQQQSDCSANCIDLGDLADQVEAAVAAAAAASCHADENAPTDDAVANWLALAAGVESMGGDGSAARDCAERIFDELVQAARAEAIVDPTDAHLERLLQLWGEAATLGFDTTAATDAIDAALRAMITRYTTLCESDAATGQLHLQRGRNFADALGGGFPGGGGLLAAFDAALAGCSPDRAIETFGVSVIDAEDKLTDFSCESALPRESWQDAQSLPRTVTAAGCGGTAQVTVTELTPGRYAVRLGGAAANTYTTVWVALTVKVSPGPLTIRVTQTGGSLSAASQSSVQLSGQTVLQAGTWGPNVLTMDAPWLRTVEVAPAEPGEPFSRSGLSIRGDFLFSGQTASELTFEVEFLTR